MDNGFLVFFFFCWHNILYRKLSAFFVFQMLFIQNPLPFGASYVSAEDRAMNSYPLAVLLARWYVKAIKLLQRLTSSWLARV